MKTYIKNPPKAQDPLAGDLSEVISKAKWRRLRLILRPKDTTVTLRMPKALVDEAKKVAKKKNVKYQSMMRDVIADYVSKAA